MNKKRIDILLVERGLAESRNRAQRLVMAGEVRVDGEMVHKSSTQVALDAHIEVKQKPKYVSRGGKKLAAAIEAFCVNVKGKVCADVGASTGGFTDCLLQNGAVKVYAIDVGYGVLHWKLRQDPRVIVMERINARYLDALPESIDLVTIDASFISLALILPAVKSWFEGADGQTGVIKDEAVHELVLKETLMSAHALGFWPMGLIPSPIRGPKGNVEFLVNLLLGQQDEPFKLDWMVEKALNEMLD